MNNGKFRERDNSEEEDAIISISGENGEVLGFCPGREKVFEKKAAAE